MGGTKSVVVEQFILALPRYQRELIHNLIYGTVQLPRPWLSAAEAEIVLVDEDTVLDAAQKEACQSLLRRLTHLCHDVIPTLIEQDISRRRRLQPRALGRGDAETLRRGRGPAAVRALLLGGLQWWPEQLPAHLGGAVARTLDEVLAHRASARSASSAIDKVTPLLEPCRSIVVEYASRRRLAAPDVSWLASEVLAQLIRNAENGRLPSDLRAWTLGTAVKKWRYREHSAGRLRPADYASGTTDAVGDEVCERLDLQRALREAGQQMARRAELLARVGDSDQFNVVAHEVAAELMQAADVQRVVDVVDQTSEGTEILESELARHGLDVSPARRRAVSRIIRDALHDVLERAQGRGARESS
jgi:hypothetical protein